MRPRRRWRAARRWGALRSGLKPNAGARPGSPRAGGAGPPLPAASCAVRAAGALLASGAWRGPRSAAGARTRRGLGVQRGVCNEKTSQDERAAGQPGGKVPGGGVTSLRGEAFPCPGSRRFAGRGTRRGSTWRCRSVPAGGGGVRSDREGSGSASLSSLLSHSKG